MKHGSLLTKFIILIMVGVCVKLFYLELELASPETRKSVPEAVTLVLYRHIFFLIFLHFTFLCLQQLSALLNCPYLHFN